MRVFNKLHRLWFLGYNRLKTRCHFAFFGWSRESGTVTFHVSLFSALAQATSLSGMCVHLGAFIGCCWMML